MLWKILTEPNGVSQDVWHVFRKLPSTVCLLLWYLAILTQISLSFEFPSFPLGGGRVRSPYRSKLLECCLHFMGYLAPICTNSFSRPSLFKKSIRKFNVACWAYSFPLTFLTLAATEYAQEVRVRVATVLMLVLSVLSTLVFLYLILLTAANADRLLGETDPIVGFSNNLKSST
ncbi:hypothetical protein CRYUN_Cryun32bG0020400 [Craigia yunnanensis]